MPKWEEYKAHARERGALALELFIVESTPSADGPPVPDVLPDHLAYQWDMEIAGNLAFAGPLSDLSGDLMEGTGMLVYRAESLDEARAMADGDPMHKTGARTYTLRRWLINEGSLSLSVGLSTKSVTLR
ncbi:YciI family protein [Shimia sp. MIT910701]|uniref:YciI family protein n=1 Tax=Shimia sp. MIT910701 TaxID=3096987 RepID=UPI00399A0BB1